MVALDHHPEIANKIGHLMAFYAGLEYQMFILYTLIATFPIQNISIDDVNKCFAEFYRWRSVNNKSKLVLDIAKPKVDSLRYRALERIWRRFKGAANRRTDIAHCVYMGRQSTQLMRLKITGLKPSFEPLDEKYFERTNLQFHTLMQDIGVLTTFFVVYPERLGSLLRSLPLPPDIQFPDEVLARPAPIDQHALDESKASVSRLGLLPLYKA